MVFCGCFVVFCGCFASVLQYFHKTHAKHPKNIEKHWKTQKNTIRSCIAGVFQEQKKSTVLHKTLFTKHLQNTAKHRKTPQNSHNTRFVKLRRKTLQNARKNARKRHKTLTILFNTATLRIARIRCFLPKYARSAAKAYNTQYTRKLRRGGHVPAGGHHVAGLWMFFKNSVLRCFAVLCSVLRCFMRVFSAFFTKQHKTDQKVYKTHKRTKRTKYALCNTAQYGAVHLSLTQKMSIQKTSAKHVQNIAKPPQNTAKHCFLKNTCKTPQNTRKTPTKHRKTSQNTTTHIC